MSFPGLGDGEKGLGAGRRRGAATI